MIAHYIKLAVFVIGLINAGLSLWFAWVTSHAEVADEAMGSTWAALLFGALALFCGMFLAVWAFISWLI